MLYETSALTSNFSFTVNFRGFSYFESETGQATSSPIVELEDNLWSVTIYPGGYREESKGYLSCFLKSESLVTIKASYSITLVGLNEEKTRTYQRMRTFKKDQSWGYPNFISLEELKDPSNGYYNDDTIVIRFDISIYGGLEMKVHDAPWTNTRITNNGPQESTLKNDLSSMLFNTLLSDITIHVGEERIPAHHFVLATRSEVFRAMFSSNMIEATERVVHIDDFDLPVVESHLSSTLTIANAAKVLKMADMCNAQKLRSSALDFIACNPKAVVEKNGFSQHMDRQLLFDVICRLSGVPSTTIDTQPIAEEEEQEQEEQEQEEEVEVLSVSLVSSDRTKKRKRRAE
eukprot:scaffold131_cov174-Ochromonas_danica.AAC.18